ncbi:hypothetical protein C900_05330 [Fulvivirga imtechensis AK7]|uniref:Uncharacterized protein n=1 Tax=Fulvivirga imtechensis AK7 TaxID=1237149 RepID=L8JP47_9BACT|nr:hypothetical protein C900_05330 [Fulvivirga imtechensis AK7]
MVDYQHSKKYQCFSSAKLEYCLAGSQMRFSFMEFAIGSKS